MEVRTMGIRKRERKSSRGVKEDGESGKKMVEESTKFEMLRGGNNGVLTFLNMPTTNAKKEYEKMFSHDETTHVVNF